MFISNCHQVSEIVPVIQSKLSKADDCRSWAVAGEKIKLEEAISEILVADTNSESGAETSDVEDYFEEEEEEDYHHYPQQKSNHRLQQVADYQPAVQQARGLHRQFWSYG